jgi:hypothetical protein
MNVSTIILILPAVSLWALGAYYIYKFNKQQKYTPVVKKITTTLLGPFSLWKKLNLMDDQSKIYLKKFYLYASLFVIYLMLLMPMASVFVV